MPAEPGGLARLIHDVIRRAPQFICALVSHESNLPSKSFNALRALQSGLQFISGMQADGTSFADLAFRVTTSLQLDKTMIFGRQLPRTVGSN
jgi:hypothetical protein